VNRAGHTVRHLDEFSSNNWA
jgi:hypothetical protein